MTSHPQDAYGLNLPTSARQPPDVSRDVALPGAPGADGGRGSQMRDYTNRAVANERWSPKWALVVAGMIAALAAAGIVWALAMIVGGMRMTGTDNKGAQLAIAAGMIAGLGVLPVFAASVGYLAKRRWWMFQFAAGSVAVIGLLALWAQTW